MLNIQINNPSLELLLKQTYGNDNQSIAEAFYEFLKQKKIQQDVDISITQLDNGEGIPLEQAMNRIRSKYE